MIATDAPRDTRLLDVTDSACLPEAIAAAQAALTAGEVVVFPTDTVYGVGCDLRQPQAIERLYWAKQRPHELPIPVLVSSYEHVGQVAHSLPGDLGALAEHHWPGGLTLILPRRDDVPDALGLGKQTVAVRMPDHPVALALIDAMGGALAVTSANLSGNPSPSTAEMARADLEGRVALILNGGPCPGGVASTIIDLVGRPPRLLRAGALSAETLRMILTDLVD